ncbi:MAG: FtsX-like permease family protein [Simkaniaceae bacterium]|nr:FtsX-like permease family protein [Simkaniaceae bacterium]
MFEFHFARKYLVPKKNRLSASLIACLSCLVISLVIWLLLLFLSVTEGLEKNWLKKLTTINAPVRIVPTNEYYNSYYYLSDSISSESNYSLKTIYEKLQASQTDPYNPEFDEEIPSYWPESLKNSHHQMVDLIKTTYQSINELPFKGIRASDYQVTAAMLKLNLIRPSFQGYDESYISQATYLSTLDQDQPQLSSLLLPPTESDINHLLFLVKWKGSQDNSIFQRIFSHLDLQETRPASRRFSLPHHALPPSHVFDVWVHTKQTDAIRHVILPEEMSEERPGYFAASLYRNDDHLVLEIDGKKHPLPSRTPLVMDVSTRFQSTLLKTTFLSAHDLSEIFVEATAFLQNTSINATLSLADLEITKADIKHAFDTPPFIEPIWPYQVQDKVHIPKKAWMDATGVLVPKNFKNSGVSIGDKGSLSYAAFTGTTSQEMNAPIFVAGFYDPGVMGIGARYILAQRSTVEAIAASNTSHSLDPMMSNGINIWFPDLKKTPQIVTALQNMLDSYKIAPYFNIIPYYEFEFAKDLIQQLQSDRYIFTLVGIIILAVAGCNIISALLLLVNDKKKEIGILKAMGTSNRSIIFIFSLCGLTLGILSFIIGAGAAALTLQNIDSLVHFLSFLQGQNAFNPEIYGQNLPNTLSMRAFIIMAVATPIVSLLAGFLPALKASRISPTHILRSES